MPSDYLLRIIFRWSWHWWILETSAFGDDTKVSICYTQKCTTLRCIKDSAMDTTSESQCFSAEHKNGERSAIDTFCHQMVSLHSFFDHKQEQEIIAHVPVVVWRSWQNSLELESMIPPKCTEWLPQKSRISVRQQTSVYSGWNLTAITENCSHRC